MEINNNPLFIQMDEVSSINKEKAALLYNIVFGYTDYNKPAVTFDYEYLYTLIHPFIITKELFESKSNPPQGDSISLNKPSNGKVNYEPIKIIFSENEEGFPTTPPTHHPPTHPHPPRPLAGPLRGEEARCAAQHQCCRSWPRRAGWLSGRLGGS